MAKHRAFVYCTFHIEIPEIEAEDPIAAAHAALTTFWPDPDRFQCEGMEFADEATSILVDPLFPDGSTDYDSSVDFDVLADPAPSSGSTFGMDRSRLAAALFSSAASMVSEGKTGGAAELSKAAAEWFSFQWPDPVKSSSLERLDAHRRHENLLSVLLPAVKPAGADAAAPPSPVSEEDENA